MSEPSPEIAAAKRALRAAMKSRILAMPTSARAEASARIVGSLLATPVFARAGACMAYLALPDEPDLTELLAAITATGRALVLPRVDARDKSLHPSVVENLSTDLAPARAGFLEPLPTCPILPASALGLVIVPALAYDRVSQVRLGRGGGVYDRWLLGYAGATRAPCVPGRGGSDPVVVGVCFDEQLVDNLPTQPHDARVDAIITDRRVLDISGCLAG